MGESMGERVGESRTAESRTAESRTAEKGTAAPPRRSWVATAREPAVVRRSLRVAAAVGTLLVAINYGDRALAGHLGPADRVEMLLTYLVPYGVATYAAVQAIRSRGWRARGGRHLAAAVDVTPGPGLA